MVFKRETVVEKYSEVTVVWEMRQCGVGGCLRRGI